MKVNIGLLNKRIDESQLSREEIAAKLGMDYSTFYRKMKSDGNKFSIGQVHKLCDLLNLGQADSSIIFLSEDSQ